jgi:GntR family transcriptional regulator, rspAB operon transcriptional repressor
MKPEKRVPRRRGETLTEDAYHRLKDAIQRGQLPEGSFLSETELRKRFNIGRTPLREACNRLHHEELLEVVPRHGYLVSELNFRDVRDFFEARMLLETIAVQLAAERAFPSDVEQLEAILVRAKECADKPEAPEEIIRLNTEFHAVIARATRNSELTRILLGILDKRERLAYMEHRYNRYRVVDFENAHRPILEAIRKRDPAMAKEKLIGDIAHAQLHIFGQDASGAPVVGKLIGADLERRVTELPVVVRKSK